ncbi:MFS transporter permease [Thermoanaerobacterium thermosaccharolyticum]|uniref:MFS transporter permease n=1 Tax=Thermoanaerobacterium thermosaccharolyticum TaxID=1517 RepID=A0A223HVS7_THETR|nr:MFS transporter permease [Thermoanaerobacterium thermosaccharolyticum]
MIKARKAPIEDPAISSILCSPKEPPSLPLSLDCATSASRGAVRIPFPVRSIILAIKTPTHELSQKKKYLVDYRSQISNKCQYLLIVIFITNIAAKHF